MLKLVECIPNFSLSEARNPAGFQALVETAKSVPGCSLLDAQSDGSQNRTVLTMVGTPEAVLETAFQLTRRAAELIDMNHHTGEHSRMGATDVIPFVPTMHMSVEECVELSRRLGQRVWDELQIPSFLYEDAATRPERRNLAEVRKGQFEGMPEKLLQPDWAPDFGERRIHPVSSPSAQESRSWPSTSIWPPPTCRSPRRLRIPSARRPAASRPARPWASISRNAIRRRSP